MIKVFISSPYSIGDPVVNVRNQIDAADELIECGYAPYVPLLSHFQHLVHPQAYRTWMALDHEWLIVCDCLLRLPGISDGADREVEQARTMGIPVFSTIKGLRNFHEV